MTTAPNGQPDRGTTEMTAPSLAARADHRQVIAIDGPAAAGKTTVARALADRLGAIFLDTGLLYRAVTVASQRAGIAPDDASRLAILAEGLDLKIGPPSQPGRPYDVLLGGEDVTAALREPAIDANVSQVAAHPGVRAGLLPVQRRIANGGRVVMVGRDIATVVVPDAGTKIYLDASLEERARRRYLEQSARGTHVTEEHVFEDLRRRDAADSSRETSPLLQAADAIVVDSDGRTIEQIVDELAARVQAVWALGTAS